MRLLEQTQSWTGASAPVLYRLAEREVELQQLRIDTGRAPPGVRPLPLMPCSSSLSPRCCLVGSSELG
jgi:hypothetical protein